MVCSVPPATTATIPPAASTDTPASADSTSVKGRYTATRYRPDTSWGRLAVPRASVTVVSQAKSVPMRCTRTSAPGTPAAQPRALATAAASGATLTLSVSPGRRLPPSSGGGPDNPTSPEQPTPTPPTTMPARMNRFRKNAPDGFEAGLPTLFDRGPTPNACFCVTQPRIRLVQTYAGRGPLEVGAVSSRHPQTPWISSATIEDSSKLPTWSVHTLRPLASSNL